MKDLRVLTERLNELMDDYRKRRIDDIQIETYREMVLVRNGQDKLKDMLTAVPSGTSNSKIFRDIIQLKRIYQISEAIFSGARKDSSLMTEAMQIDQDTWDKNFDWTSSGSVQSPEDINRPRGKLTIRDGEKPVLVWI